MGGNYGGGQFPYAAGPGPVPNYNPNFNPNMYRQPPPNYPPNTFPNPNAPPNYPQNVPYHQQPPPNYQQNVPPPNYQQNVPYPPPPNYPPNQDFNPGHPYYPPPPMWGHPGVNHYQGYPGNFPAQGQNPYVVHQIGVARLNIDVSLIVKLIFLVYLLGQGGGPERLGFLSALAICYYLYQTGVAQRFRVGPQPPAQPGPAAAAAEQAQGAAQNQAPREEGGAVPPPAAAQPAAAAAATIYQRPGVAGEVLRFVVPFFCSLLPSWHLTPEMRYHDPNEPQPQQQPPQQQNNNIPENEPH
jgi:hypothetical protein